MLLSEKTQKTKLESDILGFLAKKVVFYDEKEQKNDGEFKKKEAENRLFLLCFLLMDLYQNTAEINQGNGVFYEEIYKDPVDKRNVEILGFFENTTKIMISSNDQQKFAMKILSVLCDDLKRKTAFFEKRDENILKSSLKNTLTQLKILKKIKISSNSNEIKVLNELPAIFTYYMSMNDSIKQDFIEENVLKSLMFIESSVKLNEWEYLESFYKMIEMMIFDKEFVFYNIAKEVLNFFYEEESGKFVKRIERIKFEEKVKSHWEGNRETLKEVLKMICVVKKKKNVGNFVIKLRKGLSIVNLFYLYEIYH